MWYRFRSYLSRTWRRGSAGGRCVWCWAVWPETRRSRSSAPSPSRHTWTTAAEPAGTGPTHEPAGHSSFQQLSSTGTGLTQLLPNTALDPDQSARDKFKTRKQLAACDWLMSDVTGVCSSSNNRRLSRLTRRRAESGLKAIIYTQHILFVAKMLFDNKYSSRYLTDSRVPEA